jgi:peptidylprolyl isomerase
MKRFTFLAGSSLLLSLSCFAEETPSDKAPERQENAAVAARPEVEISKISEAFGHLISKNLETIGVQLDMHQVIKGLQDAVAGKTSPMTEVECIQAISSVQERLFKKQAEQNLQAANAFLEKNGANKEMVVLEKGKVLYKVEKEGTGSAIEEHFSPLIRYVGKFIDGTTFSASKEEEVLGLDETIPGLKAAMLNMKEGEKRTIFIHPDLAYGTQGFLPPNSLLTFEIEVVKANTSPADNQEELSHTTPDSSKSSEIALPADLGEQIR